MMMDLQAVFLVLSSLVNFRSKNFKTFIVELVLFLKGLVYIKFAIRLCTVIGVFSNIYCVYKNVLLDAFFLKITNHVYYLTKALAHLRGELEFFFILEEGK